MACNFMVMNRTLEEVGLGAMTEEFGCPICRFNTLRTEDGRCVCTNDECQGKEPGSVPNFEEWIVGPNSCVASAKGYMVEQGWIEG